MATTDNRRAGALRERLHFQKRAIVEDGWGGIDETGEFETVFTERCGLKPLRGSESVIAARLQGQQPYVLTMRQSDTARAVTTAWRIVDADNAERVFGISAPPNDPDGRNAWFEILVTEGEVS